MFPSFWFYPLFALGWWCFFSVLGRVLQLSVMSHPANVTLLTAGKQ
jgi:hypothetical protein